MERRDFIRICAGSMGAGLAAGHAGPATAQHFPRARLTLGDGTPVKAAALAALRNYVFFYPLSHHALFPAEPRKARQAAGDQDSRNPGIRLARWCRCRAIGGVVFGDLLASADLPHA